MVTVRALQLASELTTPTEANAFQVDAVSWELESDDQVLSSKGRLSARLVLRDASGKARLFASEEGLLQITGAKDKDDFLRLLGQDALPRNRVQIRVHRAIKQGVVNMHIQAGMPMFTMPVPETGAPKLSLDSTVFDRAVALECADKLAV